MKLKFIYTCFFLSFCALVFMGNEAGRAASQNQGNTGAPGDQTLSSGAPRTCISCHGTSPSVQVDLTISVTDAAGNDIAATGYTPGELYDVKVAINTLAGSPAAYGFQIVCLNAPEGVDGSDVATWSAPGPDVQIAVAGATGRTYAEQTTASNTNEFDVKWTAPSAGSGQVTFYSCGNGVNNNNSTGGDGAACAVLNIQEAGGTATRNLLADLPFTLFPNPASDQVNIEAEVQLAGDYTLRLMDATGKNRLSQRLNWTTGQQIEALNLQDFPSGIYTLQLIHAQGSISRKVLKL
ncbi:MAG: choice-of-anchor V domain-containing protein [Bacteroidota bacterium]